MQYVKAYVLISIKTQAQYLTEPKSFSRKTVVSAGIFNSVHETLLSHLLVLQALKK